MRVTLTRRGDYAVRAMLDVAAHHPHRRKARMIAQAMDIPGQFLTQILAELVTENLLTSVAGPDGGYHLARHPDEITLLDIVQAAEGPITLDVCVLEGGSCDWVEVCPIHHTWSEAQHAFQARLNQTTLTDFVATDAAIKAGTYQPPDHTPPHTTPTPRHGGPLP